MGLQPVYNDLNPEDSNLVYSQMWVIQHTKENSATKSPRLPQEDKVRTVFFHQEPVVIYSELKKAHPDDLAEPASSRGRAHEDATENYENVPLAQRHWGWPVPFSLFCPSRHPSSLQDSAAQEAGLYGMKNNVIYERRGTCHQVPAVGNPFESMVTKGGCFSIDLNNRKSVREEGRMEATFVDSKCSSLGVHAGNKEDSNH
ncbi:hypothetical protein MC885_017350 [Smutsia gigantea]|nr:hypothetical protein MC885_017350 [Smutsia gigantea]